MEKNRIFILYFLICILLLSACADKQSAVESTLAELIQPSWNGRQVGTPGNAMAETYLKNQLINYGYRPLIGKDLSVPYEQTLPDTTTVPSFCITYQNGAKEELVAGIDFIFNCGIEAFSFQGSITNNPTKNGVSSQAALYQDFEQASHLPEGYGLILVPSERFSYKCNGNNLSKPYLVSVSPQVYDKLKSSEIKEIKVSYSPKHKLGTVYNVAGVLKGKTSKKAVVISAHFDGATSFLKIPFSCAYDNGSGTAALVEVARLMSGFRKNNVYKKDIVVCFFNGEETGLTGSAELAKEINELYDEVYNINIDCVGGKNCGSLAMMPPGEESRLLYDAVTKKLDEQQIPYNSDEGLNSDHNSFSLKGIPSMTFGQEGVFNLAHNQNDKIENLDQKEIQKICKFIYHFIIENEEKSFIDPDWKNSVNEIDTYTLQKEADKVTENISLAFNEIYVFEYNGSYYRKSGYRPLQSEEELKEYYPHASIPNFENTDILNGFTLETIDVSNEMSGPVLEYNGKHDVGKVSLELDQRNITSAKLVFVKGNDVICVCFKRNSTDPGILDLKGTKLEDEYTGYVIYSDGESGETNCFGYVDKSKERGVFVQYYTREPIIVDDTPGFMIKNKLDDKDLIMSFINAFDFKNNCNQYFDGIFGKQ